VNSSKTADSFQQAFILHRRPYSNNSLLVECFTAGYGRFPAIARGVSSGKSRTGNLLQPFSPLVIQWRGKGEVVSLVKYDQDNKPVLLKGKSLLCGFYLNELAMRLLQRNDPHPNIFHSYAKAITDLACNNPVDPILRQFELKLLHELGYGITLDYDAETGQPVEQDKYYDFVLEQGPVRSSRKTEQTISGRTLHALSNQTAMDVEQWREARRLTRKILNFYLGNVPLKSRDLFRTKL
jgi:DNA repair protein RecO (recombination protein O)